MASVHLLHELAAAGLVCVTCFERELLLRLTTGGSRLSVVILDTAVATQPLIATLREQARCPVLLFQDRDATTVGHRYGADAVVSGWRPIRPQVEPWLGTALEYAGLRLDRHRQQAFWRGTPLRLTPQQFRLLWRLGEANGAVVPLAELSEVVYEGHVGNDRQRVMAHVRRIRRMIEADPQHPQVIKAVRGVGFRLAG